MTRNMLQRFITAQVPGICTGRVPHRALLLLYFEKFVKFNFGARLCPGRKNKYQKRVSEYICAVQVARALL